MDLDADARRRAQQDLPQRFADRLGEHHVGDATVLEEGVGTMARAVDELIDQHEVTGLDLFAHRAHGRDREDAADAELLHPPQVRARVDLAGVDAVPAPVAREEHHRDVPEAARHVRVGRSAEGRRECDLADLFEAFHVVEAGAADHADDVSSSLFAHLGCRGGSWSKEARSRHATEWVGGSLHAAASRRRRRISDRRRRATASVRGRTRR